MKIAKVIAQDGQGKILLGKRSADSFFPGHWELFGGRVDEDESLAEGACREFFEETGVILTEEDLVFHEEQIVRIDDEVFNVNIYSARLDSSKILIDLDPGEHQEFGWFPANSLPSPLLEHIEEPVQHLL